MKSLLQHTLGDAWDQLPPALQAHHGPGMSVDIGHMDVEFPPLMRPVLTALAGLGALVSRRGKGVQTRVDKAFDGHRRQTWHRTLRYADGQTLHFNSVWERLPNGHLVEYVNPWLGLEMAPRVLGGQLHVDGVCFVVRLGRGMLRIPEWLLLGHTTIVERALDDRHFAMDFRLTHPLLGQVFRYAGTFTTSPGGSASGPHWRLPEPCPAL